MSGHESHWPSWRTAVLTASAMLAFAGNSLLCRAALERGLIDAASFTGVRIASGAVMLGLLGLRRRRRRPGADRDWRAALMLFAYMACFSFAYLSLSAGTGALILFGAVQLTMFAAAFRGGERLSRLALTGLAAAIGGLVYLVSPGVTAPSPAGAGLMAAAGLAWGFYSLLGRGASDPLAATASNFLWSVPLGALLCGTFIGDIELSAAGAGLAAASGAVASGLGYTLWYAALGDLSAGRAATVQLSVPVIAAVGGVLLLSEPVTLRLVVASAATLGGIGLVLTQRTRQRSKQRIQ